MQLEHMTQSRKSLIEKIINDVDKSFLCLYLFTSLSKSFMIKGDGTNNEPFLLLTKISKLKERER